MKNLITAVPTIEGIKFGIVGVANTALDFSLFWILVTYLSVQPLLANTASYSVGVFNSFFLNKFWTFGSAAQRADSVRQFSSFALVSIVSLALSNAILWIASLFLALIYAKGVSICGTFIFNFLASKFFVFHGSKAS